MTNLKYAKQIYNKHMCIEDLQFMYICIELYFEVCTQILQNNL